ASRHVASVVRMLRSSSTTRTRSFGAAVGVIGRKTPHFKNGHATNFPLFVANLPPASPGSKTASEGVSGHLSDPRRPPPGAPDGPGPHSAGGRRTARRDTRKRGQLGA